MRVEILLRSGNQLASELIDPQALFNDHLSSTKHKFTIPSKLSSPTSPLVSDHEAQRISFSLGDITSIVGI